MNLIDRTIAYFSPQAAVRRIAARKMLQILAAGYSEGGASTKKKSMRGWTAAAGSPKDDIDLNLNTLRARSRDLFMNTPLGAAALKTPKTNVIGPGLRLKARIDAEYLGLTEEQADAWERQVEREFALWAESKYCDALRISDFYDLQGIAFLGCLMNGDAFVLFKRNQPTAWMPYTLRLHLIEADRVSTPWANVLLGSIEGVNPENGNQIISGVEIDDKGMVVAYWICNSYPITTGLDAAKRKEWVRVEAYGSETGRPNVLHLMDAERAEQRRGVPYLAPVIESLKQLTRYTEAELMAAVIAGMFTVFIKSQGPSSDMPLGSMIPDDQKIAADDQTVYELGVGAINVLNPGEDIEVADPKRPNSSFDAFVNALCRHIGAALEIPQELLQKSFQSSYSASRAALLEAWKMFRTRRSWIAKDFCQPVYEEWLAEAVAIGRIRAPGFFSDPAIRRAWSSAEWNGPAPGQVDPLKEVQAAGERIKLGLSTRERETIEITGGDFDRNIKQLARETTQMQQAGIIETGGEPLE
ncbi:phage portal protein [Moorella sp. E306M]|uniref:phage portal protein n=1 Tax=Moorella sp. E306M TaxID=2572683 RepID=UPI0010FFC620|nr:phage portal protein [Moorella sp. E306M]GEA17750.1 phage portal protein [Moorella sp. E306M]GEA17819.1 phage portal protein [Moorella sp. E306M]